MWWQFSLRSLLLVVTLLAVALAVGRTQIIDWWRVREQRRHSEAVVREALEWIRAHQSPGWNLEEICNESEQTSRSSSSGNPATYKRPTGNHCSSASEDASAGEFENCFFNIIY